MDTTTIYNYDALNNHIDGSEIVEVCDGKLRIGSLETGLLTLELNENTRVPELKSLTGDHELRNYSRMRKAELVTLLQMFCTIFLRRLGRLQTLIIFNS